MSPSQAIRIAAAELYRELPERSETEIAASVALDVSAAIKPMLDGIPFRVGVVRHGSGHRAIVAIQGFEQFSGNRQHELAMAIFRAGPSLLRWKQYA